MVCPYTLVCARIGKDEKLNCDEDYTLCNKYDYFVKVESTTEEFFRDKEGLAHVTKWEERRKNARNKLNTL